jgi:hypothetical protein
MDKVRAFVDSVSMQLQVALDVGLTAGVDASPSAADDRMLTPTLRHVDWSDEAPGRMTRNGLGSLEIGSGKTRVDE